MKTASHTPVHSAGRLLRLLPGPDGLLMGDMVLGPLMDVLMRDMGQGPLMDVLMGDMRLGPLLDVLQQHAAQHTRGLLFLDQVDVVCAC